MPLPPGFILLQVTPALDAGGVERTTVDVAAAVVRAGGRAIVACSGGRLEPELIAAGAESVRLPVQSKNPITLIANAWRLKALIRRERVSIVHARSRAPALSGLWAARATGTPFIATYAGVYAARSALKRWYNSVMTRGDLVIANSGYTRDHLIAQHGVDPERVVTIPRGIDLSVFDPAVVSAERVGAVRVAWGLDDRPTLLLAGRLTRWKGHLLALEAVARLGDVPLRMIFAGDDQGRAGYRAELEARIAALGLSDRVSIVGHCADMPAAYLAADLVLAPSLAPEAFGRTAVEPQAMGRPVLAADHGGARETLIHGDAGWLATPGDVDAWTAALRAALAAGPDAWARMGQAGMARARDLYSVQAMTAATLDVYARLLANRDAAAR